MLTWLGIGAQRSGTTWFTDLLTQHPDCQLGVSGQKELHILDRMIGNGDLEMARSAYAKEFGSVSGAAGEFTPSYLRALWVPQAATQLLDPKVVIVLLRDPIERFESALRMNRGLAAKRRPKRAPGFLSSRAIEAQWASSYLPQLEEWSAAVGRNRMLVLQYEAVVLNTAPAVAQAWERMGLDPAPLILPTRSARPQSADGVKDGRVTGERALARLVASQRKGLEDWGMDFDLWPRLRGSIE